MTILSILQHSLGVDAFGRGNMYRDHFVAGEGHSDYSTCLTAVEQGLMIRQQNKHVVGGCIFFVTDAGRAYVRDHSPHPPKRTRSQQRYERYLNADSNLPFGEWLKVAEAAA